MGRLAMETMAEIDIWLRQQDQKREAILNKQRDRALEKIEATKIELIKKHRHSFYKKQLEIMRGYIKKYKWLPNSYRGILKKMVEETLNGGVGDGYTE